LIAHAQTAPALHPIIHPKSGCALIVEPTSELTSMKVSAFAVITFELIFSDSDEFIITSQYNFETQSS
jgi:hypothetical protein